MKKNLASIDAQEFVPPPDKISKKIDGSNAVKVTAYDIDGSNFRFLAEFVAYRWVEPGTNAVYLKNEKIKFMIPFPETEEIRTNLNIGNLSSRLLELEEQIKQEYEEDNPTINEKDLEHEYITLKAKLRTILYSSHSSFMGSKSGLNHLVVARKGSIFYPLRFDTDTSTIHTVSNARNTVTRTLESNKRTKYGSLANITTIGLIFIIVSFCAGGLGVYSWYKAFQTLEETPNIQAMGNLLEVCTNGIRENNEEIQDSIVKGVANSMMQQQQNQDPVGSGG